MDRREAVMKNFEKYSDYTNDRINSGIENNRKGYAFIELTDEDGKPIENAEITAVQKTHEFKYGANIFMLDQMETPEKNAAYKEYFKQTFNMATLGFYWADLEPEKGKQRYESGSPFIYRRPPIDDCIKFCEENGIETREHALAYDHFFPEWLRGRDDNTVKREYDRRCREISERYADKIPTIEVTNEMYWDTGVTDFYFNRDYVTHCFKIADKYFSGNELAINEATPFAWCWDSPNNIENTRYYQLAKSLIDNNIRLDAIAMQYHMFYSRGDEAKSTEPYYNPYHLYKVMDSYAKLGKPLQISEITIPAYSNSEEDEELQADLIEKLYSIWFSHANVEQIIYWNVVDGYAAFAPMGDMTSGENYFYGGLVRHDLTPKPSLKRIQYLFGEKWRTNCDFNIKNGFGSFKGFYGEYELTVKHGNKTVVKKINLSKNLSNKFTIKL